MTKSTVIWVMLEPIGFTNNSDGLINGDQGIDSVGKIKALDDDMAENMCKVLHRIVVTDKGGGADTGVEVYARSDDNC